MTDVEKFEFLRRNAGKWTCGIDDSTWTKENGTPKKPKVYFSCFGNAFHGLTIDEAIEEAFKYEQELV